MLPCENGLPSGLFIDTIGSVDGLTFVARGIMKGAVGKILLLLVTALMLALPSASAHAIQCVAYAREASGVRLQGDAWQWWDAAQGVYGRGEAPRQGAVLVFGRQGSMRHGHVSVVTRVVSNRVVLVDHANWAPARGEGRGQVARAVPVMDVSANNDWSQVRVWYRPAALYGNRVYHTQGFVYGHGKGDDIGPQPIETLALEQVAKTPLRHSAHFPVAAPAIRPRPRPAELAQNLANGNRHPGGG